MRPDVELRESQRDSCKCTVCDGGLPKGTEMLSLKFVPSKRMRGCQLCLDCAEEVFNELKIAFY